MILMIDNYDSFTYNLVQYMAQMDADIHVVRNDHITIDDIRAMPLNGIVISPGPGRPESAGVSLAVVEALSGTVPILGVCLGHQTIAQAFGARIVRAGRLMHGKTSTVTADGQGLFAGIGKPFQAMRYHSLAVDRDSLPGCLMVTGETEDGEIMGLRHREHATEGIQFHPESIMTPIGKRLLRNFLSITESAQPADITQNAQGDR